jgi:arsenate reductase
MSLTIYHNPRCSKSRKTLQLLQESGSEHEIVDYLSEPPTAERILQLAALLGVPVAELLRRGENEFTTAQNLPDIADDGALAGWIARNPRVLQRPIVVDDDANRAVVGRPPESVLELISL